MTLLLLLVVLTFSTAVVIAMVRSHFPDEALMPVTGFACMAIALTSILLSLRKCLPAILETEQHAQHGFAVIPVARIAPAARRMSSAGDITSPYSSQSDPSPPHTPHQP